MTHAAQRPPCILTLPASGGRAAIRVPHTMGADIEHSRSMVLITDLQGRIEYVNEAFVRATGYCRQDVLGRNARMLQSGTTNARTQADIGATLRAGRVWWGELRNRCKDGRTFVERVCMTPLRLPTGQITHVVATKEAIGPPAPARARAGRHRQCTRPSPPGPTLPGTGCHPRNHKRPSHD